MRHTPRYLACAGLELARYFALVYAAGPFSTGWPMAPTVLRIVATPNLLFAAAFMFLGLNSDKYAAYRPLVILGKVVSVFSTVLALPGLLRFGGEDPNGDISYALLAIAVWDILTIAVLLIPGKNRAASAAPAGGTEPEHVELD